MVGLRAPEDVTGPGGAAFLVHAHGCGQEASVPHPCSSPCGRWLPLQQSAGEGRQRHPASVSSCLWHTTPPPAALVRRGSLSLAPTQQEGTPRARFWEVGIAGGHLGGRLSQPGTRPIFRTGSWGVTITLVSLLGRIPCGSVALNLPIVVSP